MKYMQIIWKHMKNYGVSARICKRDQRGDKNHIRHDICFTAALAKLIQAGAEALEERKEASDGSDRR